jgi:hypothetical protein
LLSGNAQQGKLAQAFHSFISAFRANIGGIHKVRNEYHVYMTDAQGRWCLIPPVWPWGKITRAGTMSG